jgi:hypothetical protein
LTIDPSARPSAMDLSGDEWLKDAWGMKKWLLLSAYYFAQ